MCTAFNHFTAITRTVFKEMYFHKYYIKLCAVLGTCFALAVIYYYRKNEPIRKYFVVPTTHNNNRHVGLPVITNVAGGIGNQLFEFACAYAIARKRNSNVYVLKPADAVLNKHHVHSATGRDFSLDHFLTFSESVAEDFRSLGSGNVFDFTECHILEQSIPADEVVRVDDVCSSELYFKEYRDEIKEKFTLKIDENPIKGLLDRAENSESISVHVRRGDYMYPADNRTIPITFQKKAMKMMERFVPNATFFIFTDDLDYVRKELGEYRNVIFVDNSMEQMASLLDFLLMSRCKHNIIANSSFSWWSAYLNRNKDKIVVGPMPRHPAGWNDWFYKDKKLRKCRELVLNYYLYPTEWLTLNPFEY